jgi:hypothetical protein
LVSDHLEDEIVFMSHVIYSGEELRGGLDFNENKKQELGGCAEY